MNSLEELKESGEAPEWSTEESIFTLYKGYLLENETPKGMYKRLAKAASERLKRPDLETKFFDLFWNNWLCPSSPVCSNFGSSRGLPISCYASNVDDDLSSIFKGFHETAMLSKNGGGCGKYWGHLRSRGEKIKSNGTSDGIVGWLKIEDQVISGVSQGSTRRGACANYLPVRHGDIEEFLNIRRQTGDESRKCRSIGFHHAVCIDDDFMQSVKLGGEKERQLWSDILKTRWETGEPYLMFSDNANNQAPQMYKDKGLKIETSNLCSEIFLHNDKDHTFVCCLSSMNLFRFDEWKNTDAVELAIYFLDAVMEEFIEKASKIEGLEKAVRFAVKSRALGLGALGWHTLLQSKGIPFDSFEAMWLNNEVFKLIDTQSRSASEKLALDYGEPEWCVGYGVRNTHLTAIAPTLSNSIISGGVSEGIQPVVSNIYAQKTAKGTFLRKNPILEDLLTEKNKNHIDTWNIINSNKGSVKSLDFLSTEEKELFLTAREINQFSIVRQAGQRQKYIQQGQSVNLFFTSLENQDSETKKKLAKYVHEVHFEAWELGLKSLYYLKTESALKGDSIYHTDGECKSCEG